MNKCAGFRNLNLWMSYIYHSVEGVSLDNCIEVIMVNAAIYSLVDIFQCSRKLSEVFNGTFDFGQLLSL